MILIFRCLITVINERRQRRGLGGAFVEVEVNVKVNFYARVRRTLQHCHNATRKFSPSHDHDISVVGAIRMMALQNLMMGCGLMTPAILVPK